MDKIIKLVIILLALFEVSHSVYAADAPPDPHSEVVKSAITEFMAKNNVPGVAVLMYVNGKPYSYYYGYSNLEKKYYVNAYSIFEIGSISKVMTSLLFAQEMDFAKMLLTDSVRQYIPNLPESYADIKLLNLATHTAGLAFSTPKPVNNAQQLDAYLTQNEPDATPGTEWRYSNVGMGLLGLALEKSTEKDYDWLYHRHIALPLKMHDIGVNVPVNLQKFVAQGYDKNNQPVSPSQFGTLAGAGGVKISAGDMQRFLGAAIGLPETPERVLFPMMMTQSAYVQLPHSMQGLGWQIYPFAKYSPYTLAHSGGEALFTAQRSTVIAQPIYTKNALIDKTGATQGYRSYIAVIPGKKSGIAILANKYVDNTSIVTTGRKILFRVTGLN